MDENMTLTPYETREILFYKTDNGDVRVEILLYQENLWLTQAKMAELFEVQKAAISKHLKNIFASGELMEDSVVSILETTAADGKNYPTKYYNLDAIIAVGYRVNSKKATMFRIWANRILKEYIIKGYVMDDERLKEPENFFGKDYFEEQLERIRDIRSSERRFYQKITDIYSQCSADYDVDSPVIEPEDLAVIGHTGDLLADIYARNLTHIYFLPQCSTTAARVLNPAGMDAQFERLRCAISRGILK